MLQWIMKVTGYSADAQIGEAQFQAVFDAAAIGVALVDPQGRPVRCNPALERILGYSEAELRGMAFPEFTHPDDLQSDLELYRSLLAKERDSYQIEKRYIRKDRQIVWTRLTVSVIQPRDNSRSPLVVAMVEDVTTRRAAQEQLRESEEKFFKAFHGNPHPTLITRAADATILEANQCFAEWFNVTTAAAKGRTAFDFGIWDSPEEREWLLRHLRKEGLLKDAQKTVVLPSGERRIVLLSSQPISIGGEDCLLTISTDVTRQKMAEQALRRSEEHLRRGLEAARMGIWEWNLATNEVVWSDGVHSLFGLAPGEFDGTFEAVLKLVDAVDRERVQDELRSTIECPGRNYYSELRVRWPDDSIHWIEGRGEVNRDKNGTALSMVGTVADITDRKRAELALRGSEESLRATLENTPNVPVQWYDANGRVLFWNTASEIIFGWKASEAKGRMLDELVLDSQEFTQFLSALQQVERTGQSMPPTECRFHRKDGSEGFCISTIFQIPGQADSLRFACMDVEITERMRAERSAREAQERELKSRDAFARELIQVAEQERQRLAAELHDSLGQSLSIIKNCAYLAHGGSGVPQPVLDHLNTISESAASAIDEVRRLVQNLRPIQIEQFGLTDSIRGLVEKVAQSTTIRLQYRIEDVDRTFAGESAVHLYRIVQEALNNLIKHSGARCAELALERDMRCVRLRLADDGAGFEVADAPAHGGFGLTSIAERAQILGGAAKIESLPGSGTRLLIEVPISDEKTLA